MTYSSCQVSSLTPFILDTSVLINLHASRYGGRIIDALPNAIIVSKIVVSEMEHETSKTKGGQQFMKDLVGTSKVSLATMNNREYGLFESLVTGVPSLGDGEASTIVIGVSRGLLPVIDERRGRQRAHVLLSGKHPGWSLDLFRHPQVLAELGPREARDALYYALRDGRMRIDELHCDVVVSVIGVERALECTSLPKYKARQSRWQVSADAKIRCRTA